VAVAKVIDATRAWERLYDSIPRKWWGLLERYRLIYVVWKREMRKGSFKILEPKDPRDYVGW